MWRWVRVVFSLAVAIVLVVVCVRAVSDLSSVSLDVDPPWLALGWVVALGAFPILAVAWSAVLTSYGQPLAVGAAVRIWCLAQASRYLPTGLAAVASRAVLATGEGVPASLTVTTIAVEGGLLVAWSGLGGAVLLVAGGHEAVIPLVAAGGAGVIGVPVILILAGKVGTGAGADRDGARAGAGAGADRDGAGAGAGAGAAGRVAAGRVAVARRWAAGLVARLTHRPGPPDALPLVAADLTVGINMAVKTVAFVLLARALLPVHGTDLALLAGAANVAAVAGLIGITPAGIGVREGVLAALLGHRFGIADATALALAARVFDLAVEVPWVLGAVIARRRGSPSPPPPLPAARHRQPGTRSN